METDEKRIVEISGIKMEVDMRTAKRIDTFKVGDAVKILKRQYSNTWNTYIGVIVGFTEFKSQPAIEVMILSNELDKPELSIECITEKSEGLEMAPFNEYEIVFKRADILEKINRQISMKEEEVRVMKTKRAAFEKHFAKAFEKEMV